jgi:hypothetical protein
LRNSKEIIGTGLLLLIVSMIVLWHMWQVGQVSEGGIKVVLSTWDEALKGVDRDEQWGYDINKTSLGFRSLFIEAPFELLEEFGRHNWTPAEVSLLDYETGEPDLDQVRAQVRGRGNTTWSMSMSSASRPLRMRLQEKADIMGVGEARNYILLASSNEKSHFRNWTALTIASQMGGLGYVPSVEFLNVYFNNRFIGVYLLTDERDIEPHRSPVITNKVPSRSEFLLEKNSRASGDLNYDYVIVDGSRIEMREPSGFKGGSEGHGRVVTDLVTEFTGVLRQSAEEDNFELFRRYFDVESFIDFYLLNYSLGVLDFGELSVWFELRFSDEGRLGELSGLDAGRLVYMGPVWDFDVMADIKVEYFGLEDEIHSEWLSEALKITEFNELFNGRMGILLEILPGVREQAEQLMEYNKFNLTRSYEMGRGAIMANNSQEATELSDDFSELFEWLQLRFEWLGVNEAKPRGVPNTVRVKFLNESVDIETLGGYEFIPIVNILQVYPKGQVEWLYDRVIILNFDTFSLRFETGSSHVRVQAGRFDSGGVDLKVPVKVHNGRNVISQSDLQLILDYITGFIGEG